MNDFNHHQEIVSLDELARRLKLSKAWLRAEASAGRIPSLRAGQRRVFNPDAVSDALAKRATGDTDGGAA